MSFAQTRTEEMTEELEDQMRLCWRQMQEHRRMAQSNRTRSDYIGAYLQHEHQVRADLYRTVLRTLILVRRAGRLAR